MRRTGVFFLPRQTWVYVYLHLKLDKRLFQCICGCRCDLCHNHSISQCKSQSKAKVKVTHRLLSHSTRRASLLQVIIVSNSLDAIVFSYVSTYISHGWPTASLPPAHSHGGSLVVSGRCTAWPGVLRWQPGSHWSGPRARSHE